MCSCHAEPAEAIFFPFFCLDAKEAKDQGGKAFYAGVELRGSSSNHMVSKTILIFF
jgi:hypothetical protein